MKKFKKIAVGGTFDELHRGHKALLTRAFKVGEKVIIGLSSDNFVLKMGKPHKTASFEERKKELATFLQNNKVTDRAEIVRLDDPYGQTMTIEDLEALVVSQETEKTALAINIKRLAAQLPQLEIITVHMVPAENKDPISTTRIRRGEIDREGRLLTKSKVAH